MAQYFSDTYNRKILGINNRLAARRAHAISANAEKLDRGIEPMQSINELSPIHFTGSFPGGDQDSHAAIVRERPLLIA